jgi:hypothetical protein
LLAQHNNSLIRINSIKKENEILEAEHRQDNQELDRDKTLIQDLRNKV